MGSRISIYIDGPNLLHCGDAEGCRIDYLEKFQTFILKGRTLVDINFYNSEKRQDLGSKSFHRKLSLGGYNLKLTQLKTDQVGVPYEKRINTQIVADSMYDAFINKYDVAVICSGDADLVPAIEYLLKMGKQVEVLAFSTGFSWEMRETKKKGAKIVVLSNYLQQISR